MEAGWYLKESQSGTLYPLDKKFVTLGRISADIRLTSKTAERRHAVLGFDLKDRVYKIKDFNTAHGTYVNNKRISSDGSFVPLKTDDLLRFGQDATTYQLVKMNSQDSLNGPDCSSNRSVAANAESTGPSAILTRNPQLEAIETQSGSEMAFVPYPYEPVRLITQHPIVPANSDLHVAGRGAAVSREFPVDTDLPGHSSPEFLRKESTARPTSAPNPAGFGGFYVAQTNQSGCPPPPYSTDNLASGQQHLLYQPVNPGPVGPAAFMFPGGGVYYAAPNQSPSVMGAYIINTQHLPYHMGEFAPQQQFCSPTHQRNAAMPPTNTGCPACSHAHAGCQMALNPNIMVVPETLYQPETAEKPNNLGHRRQNCSSEAEQECPVTRLNELTAVKLSANHENFDDYSQRLTTRANSELNDSTRPQQRLVEMDSGRTPLFGQNPTWWGDQQQHQQQLSAAAGSSQSGSSSSPRSSRRDPINSECRSLSGAEQMSAERPAKPRYTMMEIPFKDDFQPPKTTAKEPMPPTKHEATAFTIEFNSDESTKIISLKKSPPDLHDKGAKRYEPRVTKSKKSSGYTSDNPVQHQVKESRSGTLSEREDLRSHPMRNSNNSSNSGHMGNVKEYLLKKLLLNSSNNSSSDSGSQTSPTDSNDLQSPSGSQPLSDLPSPSLLSVPKKDNSDNISDAGTYVIEHDDEILRIEGDFEELEARQAIDKVFGISPTTPLSPDLLDSPEDSKTPSPQLKALDEPVITPRRSYTIPENREDHHTFTVETLQMEKLAFIDADGKLSNSSSPKHIKAEPSLNFSIDAKPKKKASNFARSSHLATIKQSEDKIVVKSIDIDTESDKRGLIKQLLKITKDQQHKDELRSQQHHKSAVAEQPKKRLSEPPGNFNRAGSVRLRESPAAVQSSHKSPVIPGNFARNDGGRFSMKTTSTAAYRPISTQPGSRASLAGPSVPVKINNHPVVKAKENPELAAWLRRKGYNPLKAAAEGQKKKFSLPKESLTDLSCASSVDESPQYLSSRSMSYHAGSPQMSLPPKEIQRKLSSQDCSLAEPELISTRSDSFVIASLSRNIANDMDKLNTEVFSDEGPQVVRKRTVPTSISSPHINVQSESIEALNSITNDINSCAKNALAKIKEESLSASMEDLITQLSCRIESNDLQSSSEDISAILQRLAVVKDTYEAVNKFLSLRSSPKTSSRTHSSGEESQSRSDPQNDLRLKTTLSKMRNYWSARRPSIDSNDSNV